jgi:hypothetical protein
MTGAGVIIPRGHRRVGPDENGPCID